MNTPADIVIVGASLAGLRTAEALRVKGYRGRLTLVGDEPHAPYDRPPLSKQVLGGWVDPRQTTLPRLCAIDADWRLGVAATRVDRARRRVECSTGEALSYDRLVVATGTRSKVWSTPAEASLGGVHVLRTLEDAQALLADLEAAPSRVLVIGAGFNGCEVASACRDRGLAVTVVEINPAPLTAALGHVIGRFAAERQRRAGVDLRCGLSVSALTDDGQGRVSGARLSDGAWVSAEVVVVCLGALRNWEWLDGAGLQAGPAGVLCDDSGRVVDLEGAPLDDIFACGDVARFHHPLAGAEPVSLEHWGNAVDQASVVAANILSPGSASNQAAMPRFWSMQFGVNFKASGLPASADSAAVVQGDMASGRFVVAYGRNGRMAGVVTVNQSQWMDFYEGRILAGAAFPPDWRVVDQPAETLPMPAGFSGATPSGSGGTQSRT